MQNSSEQNSRPLENRAPEAQPVQIPLDKTAGGPPTGFFTRVAFFSIFLGLLLATLILFFAPNLREWFYALWPHAISETTPTQASRFDREFRALEKQVTNLEKRFNKLTPREPYLLVNSSNNRIVLKAGDKILHEGICSTGSYVLLKASSNREWAFFTPRGMFRILGKRVAPVWAKPDWAFVEEGLPIPPQGAPERFEAGVLGDYALELGDGYLIHGTLYKRMLGMPVTHGCVRLGDEDLRIVYHKLQLGSKVFIF